MIQYASLTQICSANSLQLYALWEEILEAASLALQELHGRNEMATRPMRSVRLSSRGDTTRFVAHRSSKESLHTRLLKIAEHALPLAEDTVSRLHAGVADGTCLNEAHEPAWIVFPLCSIDRQKHLHLRGTGSKGSMHLGRI